MPTIKTPAIELGWEGVYDGYVEVRLLEDLQLQLRGTKKAWLRPCACFIPSLMTGGDSLNEAYTKISAFYEPWRRSHTGNVFTHIFYKSATPKRERIWESLDTIRKRMEMTLESRFQFRPAVEDQSAPRSR